MARFAWYTHLRRPRKCHDGGMDMLTIIQTERMKLKRKRVCEGIWALTALLLIFAIQRAFSLSSESRLMDSLGDLFALAFKNLTGLYLPIALGILATSVFFDERKNDTLKELLIVPVTKAELYFSKAAIVLLVSISQCFFTYVGATLGGLWAKDFPNFTLEMLMNGFVLFLEGGLLIPMAMAPILLLAVLRSRDYLLPISATLLYLIPVVIAPSYVMEIHPLASALCIYAQSSPFAAEMAATLTQGAQITASPLACCLNIGIIAALCSAAAIFSLKRQAY